MRIAVTALGSALFFVAIASVVAACTEDPGRVAATEPSAPDAAVDPRPDADADAANVAPSTAPDATPATAPDVFITNETLTFGGKTRSYILAKPTGYDPNKSYPLVLSFHGNPGSAAGMAAGLPFDTVSKTAAVLVYPQADTNNWDLYTPTATNADMSFILALIDEVKTTKASIDASRVFGFGYSGGAFFLTQLTCRFGGVFRAISINAGGGPDEAQMGYPKHPNGCYVCPGGPIATLVTHGAEDNAVLPASGEFTQACYATTNGCADTLSAASPAPCQTHDGCPAATPVKWCLIPGLNHSVWADGLTESWAFFNALP